MRSLPQLLLLPLLAACAAAPSDETDRLASLQRNAGLYWEGGKLAQAMTLVGRGLEIDPYDYKLRSLEAAIHLRQSPPPNVDDQKELDLALRQFEELYDERSLSRHDRFLLFFYGLARQKQGMRLLREAEQRRIGGRTAAEQPDPAAAETLRERADHEFARATELMHELIDRGELLRLAHFHMMQIAASQGQRDKILEHGNLFLEVAGKEKGFVESEIERTTVYGYEIEKKRDLVALQTSEVQVRSFLSQLLFEDGKYTEALAHLDKILELEPTRTADLYNRGRLLAKLGRLNEAKEDMRIFLATTNLPAESTQRLEAQRVLLNQ